MAVSVAVGVGASGVLQLTTSAAASPASASLFPLSHILYVPELYLLIVPAAPPAIITPRILQPALMIAASCLAIGALCRLVRRLPPSQSRRNKFKNRPNTPVLGGSC